MNLANASVTIQTLLGGGVVDLNTTALTLSNGTFSGAINGTGSLVKTSGGLLTLSGSHAYSGATTVNVGTLTLSGTLASTAVSVASGASLNAQSGSVLPVTTVLTVDGTVNLLNSAVTLQTLLGNGTVALNTTDLTLSNGTFGGGINGTGTLVKTSGGLLTLSGSNSYNGSTSVNAGTLTLSGTLASTVLGVSSGATLNAQSGSALAATTTLTADGLVNLFNAGVTLETLLGAGVVTLDTTALTLSSGTFSGAINGTGSLVKTSSGLLTLSGSNAYSGATGVNAGTLTLSGVNPFLGTVTVNRGVLALRGATGGSIRSSTATTLVGGATLRVDDTAGFFQRLGTGTITATGGVLDLIGNNSSVNLSPGSLSVSQTSLFIKMSGTGNNTFTAQAVTLSNTGSMLDLTGVSGLGTTNKVIFGSTAGLACMLAHSTPARLRPAWPVATISCNTTPPTGSCPIRVIRRQR